MREPMKDCLPSVVSQLNESSAAVTTNVMTPRSHQSTAAKKNCRDYKSSNYSDRKSSRCQQKRKTVTRPLNKELDHLIS